MYVPEHFSETRPDELARIIRAHPLGTLITNDEDGLDAKPWKMSDSAPNYIAKMLRNIVGLEIAVTSLVGKRKLGQNREARDRLAAADELQARGNAELGTQMRGA